MRTILHSWVSRDDAFEIHEFLMSGWPGHVAPKPGIEPATAGVPSQVTVQQAADQYIALGLGLLKPRSTILTILGAVFWKSFNSKVAQRLAW